MDNKKQQYQNKARSLIAPGMTPSESKQLQATASLSGKAATPVNTPATKPQATPAYKRPDLSAEKSRAQQLLGAGFVDAGGNGSNMIFINPTTGETARNQLARDRGVEQANALVNKLVSPSNPQRMTQAGYYTPDVRNGATADFFQRSNAASQAQKQASDQAARRGMNSALARDEFMRYFTPGGDTEQRKTQAFKELMANPKFSQRVRERQANRSAMLQDRERFKNARRDILRFMNTGYVPAGEEGQQLIAGQAARQNPGEVMQMQQQAGLRQQELAMQQNAMNLEANLKQRGLDADTARAVAQQKLAEESLALRRKESEANINSQKMRDRIAAEELAASLDDKAYEADQTTYERTPDGFESKTTANLIEQGVPPATAAAMARNPMPPDAQVSNPSTIKNEYDTFISSGLPQTPEGFQAYLQSRGLFYNPSDVKRLLDSENMRNDPFNTDWTLGDPVRSLLGYRTTKENEDINNKIIGLLTGATPRQIPAAPSQPQVSPSKARAEALRKRSELLRGLAQ